MSKYCRIPLLLLLVTAVCVSCRGKKATPVETAERFFNLVQKGQTQEAYASASFAFKAQRNLQGFEATAKDLGLVNMISSTWSEGTITGSEARLDGEIRLKNGALLKCDATLLDERGAWRLYAFRMRGPDGQRVNPFNFAGSNPALSSPVDKPIPDEKKAKALVVETMGRFSEAIQHQDFTDFHAYISREWRERLGLKHMQREFQPFIDKEIVLEGTKSIEPTFTSPPEINSDGLLVLVGYFPAQPPMLAYRVVFDLRYTYELPTWKLFGVNIRIVQ